MTRIRVGCAGFVGKLSGYFRQLDAFALSETGTRSRLPTLKKWGALAPPQARFVCRLPTELSVLGFEGEAAQAAYDRTVVSARAVGATTLWLKTPADFRPTTNHRRALVSFFGGRAETDLRIAWHAQGLWDSQAEDRNAVALEAGLIPVVDPLGLDRDDIDEETLPQGDLFYWRLLGRAGGGTRFTVLDFERLVELSSDRGEGFIIFGVSAMLGDARRFRKQLAIERGGEPSGSAVVDDGSDDGGSDDEGDPDNIDEPSGPDDGTPDGP